MNEDNTFEGPEVVPNAALAEAESGLRLVMVREEGLDHKYFALSTVPKTL